ncbi:MAG: deaminase domain-containing protein [Marinagarivorans sp.]|nr:deaminase domain-containing protein [Marinagarivorans sp.]
MNKGEIKNMKNVAYQPKAHRRTYRLAAYLLCFLAVFSPVMPSFASILTDESIQTDFTSSPLFERVQLSNVQYQAPAFLEGTATAGTNLDTFKAALQKNSKSTLGAPTYIPIDVGGITTIIPIYPDHKKIGTSAVQARYILTQVQAMLGRSLINADAIGSGYYTEKDQLDTLYANALKYAQENPGLIFGTPLGVNQDGGNDTSLPYNMVWPELRSIHGEKVLVPIVYLTNATAIERKVTKDQNEFGGTVKVGALNVKNTNIKFLRDGYLETKGNLTNRGNITAQAGLEIVVGGTGTLANLSGVIAAQGGDLIIGAHNILNQTVIYRYDTGQAQGTRYGAIADITANGNVVLRSYEDIVFQGATASGQNLTLAANGNISLGSQQLFEGGQSRYGRGEKTWSAVSYLQTRLTAEENIKLVADGAIEIDAAEIVAGGHIEILAGLGITVVDSLETYQSQASGKFGKKKVDESVYQTVAIRALLDAGKGVKLSTDFGDITLKAADITSGQGTSANAKNGAVNLLMTTETDHYSYSSLKKGLFTIKTVSEGHNIETGVPNSIVGGFAVEALNGITVEYEGDPTLSTDQQLDAIAAMPGMEWIDDVRNSPDVNWEEILLAHEEWAESNTSLSPAFAAVIAIALAVATGGAGAAAASAIGATGTVSAAVVSAGVSSFISQAGMAVANGAVNGDIGGALEGLASSDTLKSLAVAMVTAGAIAKVDAAFFNVDTAGVAEAGNAATVTQAGVDSAINTTNAVAGGMSLTAQVGQAVTHAAVSAGIQAAVYDDVDFDDAFRQSLMQNATNAIGQYAAGKIGSAFDTDDATAVDTALKYISHAAVGCVIGVASASVTSGGDAESNCYAQGGGAVIGEFIASTYRDSQRVKSAQEDLEGYLDNKLDRVGDLVAAGYSEEKIKEIIKAESGQLITDVRVLAERGVDLAKLSAAIGAFAAGADAAGVNAAAAGAENAARYNAMSDYFAALHNAIEEVRLLLANPVGPLELLADKLADAVIAKGVDLANADPTAMSEVLSGVLALTGLNINSLTMAGIDITDPAVASGLLAAVIDTVGVSAILGDAVLRNQLAPFLGSDLNDATIARAEQAVDDTVAVVRNWDQILPAMKTLMDEAVIGDDPYAKAQVARLVGGVTIGMAIGELAVVAAPESLGLSLATLGAAAALRLHKALALIKKLSVEGKVNLDKILDKLPFDVKFRPNESGDGFDVDVGPRDIDLDNPGDVLDLVPKEPNVNFDRYLNNTTNPEIKDALLTRTQGLRNGLLDSFDGKGNVAVANIYIDGLPASSKAFSSYQNGENGFVKLPEGDLILEPVSVNKNGIIDGNNSYLRIYDGEFKILETTARSLKDTPMISGRIDLFSELDVCPSCGGVIAQFRMIYPNIQLNVFTKK